MARDGKVDYLATVRLFSGLDRKELTQLARIAEVVTVPAGKEVVTQGAPGHEFYFILSGTVSVLRDGAKIATLGAEQYFGELALLAHQPRNATVVADTDLEVMEVGQREFQTLLEEVPAMALKLLTAMAVRLSEADEKATWH